MINLRVITFVVAGAIVVGTVALVKLQRNEIDGLKARIATAQDTVERQAKSIDRLTQQRAIDDKTVTAFVDGMKALRETAEAQTRAITELEKTDPDAKAFLSTPIPSGLRRVLGGESP